MSDLKINNITDRTGSCGPTIAGVSTVSTTGAFVVPVGPTEMRGGRGRGITAGGYPSINTINMIEIATTGNATDFGDLVNGNYEFAGCSSSTRGVWMGGAPDTDLIQYITVSSGGGASNFGNLNEGAYPWDTGFNDSTRGGCMGGAGPAGRINNIQYITIATTGDSSDFGDLMLKSRRAAACSSPTRAVHFTGRDDSPGTGRTKINQYITTQTKGDALEFGELSDERDSFAGSFSSTTRGIVGGGNKPSAISNNIIDYVTIATLGNSLDFGDLTTPRISGSGTSSHTRGVFFGGYLWPSSPRVDYNIIDYVTIATLGNALDFGDLTALSRLTASFSDVNGGLG